MSVTINGKTYKGNNISVVNDKVYIDGKLLDQASPDGQGILHVHVTGTLHNLETDASVVAQNIAGTVQAGGSVNCDNVGGNVQAGGSVSCDDVQGNVMAGGSVNYG